MSEYWKYHCKTCNISSDGDINHGDKELLVVLSHIDIIKTLYDTDILDIDIMLHPDEFIPFLMEHYGHNIVVISEYGDEKIC